MSASNTAPERTSFGMSIFRWATRNPAIVAIWGFMFGFILCFAAIILNVHSVTFTGHFGVAPLRDYVVPLSVEGKEVGYLYALNWSVYGVFVLPMILFFGLRTFAHMESALEGLAERGMVRTKQMARVAPADVVAQWRKTARVNRAMFFTIIILGSIFLMFDWWTVVGEPLLDPAVLAALDGAGEAPVDRQIALNQPSYEFDWSISGLFAGVNVDRTGLLALSFFAYLTVAAISVAFAFAACVSALHFSVFVVQRGGADWRYIADATNADDPRCGWESFAPFYSNLLCTGLTVLAGLWLMVLQNSYLRDANSTDVASFVFREGLSFLDLARQEVTLTEIPSLLGDWIIGPGIDNLFANTQGGLGILLFGFVCLIALLASWWLLRSTAADSRREALRALPSVVAESGQPEENLRKRLRRMRFWPVGWIGESQLLIWMLVLFASLFSYRIVLIPLLFLALRAIDSAVRLIFNRRREEI